MEVRRQSAAKLLHSFATPCGDGAALKFERTLAKHKLSHGQLSPRGEILPSTTKDCSLWKVIPSGAGWPVEHTASLTPEFQVQITFDPRGQRTFIPLLYRFTTIPRCGSFCQPPCHKFAHDSLVQIRCACSDKLDTTKRVGRTQGNRAVEKGTLLLKSLRNPRHHWRFPIGI